ncbi:MAG: transcription elongation factor GreA [Gammaproteobacteria bacterium TMED243]|jgi:transcription elongation factor GreA|nr:transcription elongation factor GreA [Gammaproteobacteria bacterium]RPG28757.1 MAG: transcription elongation factor GreA [Gammaproteobacteria bacterium TMED243]
MPNPMTVKGAESLREELAHRKGALRQEIAEAIAEARAHGDLKENAEYHAAREQQSFNEGRAQEIEARLADAQIIDVTKIEATGKVIFGSTVTLIDCNTDETIRYHIVGEDEADLKQNKISVMSPIARALIGKMEDDVVTVSTPGGDREYEVSAVELI